MASNLTKPFKILLLDLNGTFMFEQDRFGPEQDYSATYRADGGTRLTAAEISTARVYLASEALELGMVDEVGYLDQAISQAKKLAELPENARVTVYRRTEYPDDNIYNTSTRYGGGDLSVISVDLPDALNQFQTGFYYLWPAAAMAD